MRLCEVHRELPVDRAKLAGTDSLSELELYLKIMMKHISRTLGQSGRHIERDDERRKRVRKLKRTRSE